MSRSSWRRGGGGREKERRRGEGRGKERRLRLKVRKRESRSIIVDDGTTKLVILGSSPWMTTVNNQQCVRDDLGGLMIVDIVVFAFFFVFRPLF